MFATTTSPATSPPASPQAPPPRAPSLLGLQSNNLWIDGGFSRSEINHYRLGDEHLGREQSFVLDSDLPSAMGGEDRGPTPPEYLLHALLACLTSTLNFHAAQQHIAISAIHSRASADIDTRGFTGTDSSARIALLGINVSIEVQTSSSADQLRPLLDHSPVYDTLRRGIPVSITVTTI